jgi:hypothetical protein
MGQPVDRLDQGGWVSRTTPSWMRCSRDEFVDGFVPGSLLPRF